MTNTFFCPECDLFASRLNTQVSKYASWYPEPGSRIVDAFSISWWNMKFYAFPPFSLVRRTLVKVQREESKGIVIAPLGSTQAWFPLLLQLLVDNPRLLPPRKDLLQLPGQKILVHPLYKKLASHISDKQLDSTSYRKGLCKFSAMHGGEVPDPSMTLHLEVGNNFVLEGRLIPIIPL